MGYAGSSREGGSARGLWKVVPFRYRALKDPCFPGTWRVEPVVYEGRGIVYLFRSEEEARAWAKKKNAEFQ